MTRSAPVPSPATENPRTTPPGHGRSCPSRAPRRRDLVCEGDHRRVELVPAGSCRPVWSRSTRSRPLRLRRSRPEPPGAAERVGDDHTERASGVRFERGARAAGRVGSSGSRTTCQAPARSTRRPRPRHQTNPWRIRRSRARGSEHARRLPQDHLELARSPVWRGHASWTARPRRARPAPPPSRRPCGDADDVAVLELDRWAIIAARSCLGSPGPLDGAEITRASPPPGRLGDGLASGALSACPSSAWVVRAHPTPPAAAAASAWSITSVERPG